MQIRTALEDDAAAVALLLGQLGYPADEVETRARLRLLADAPTISNEPCAEDPPALPRPFPHGRHAVLVAEVEGRLVGWIQMSTIFALESGGFSEIRGLVVDEQFRGRGIGAALVRAGEEWSVALGVRALRVRSNVIRERTHRFYEILGYARAKSQVVFTRRIP